MKKTRPHRKWVKSSPVEFIAEKWPSLDMSQRHKNAAQHGYKQHDSTTHYKDQRSRYKRSPQTVRDPFDFDTAALDFGEIKNWL